MDARFLCAVHAKGAKVCGAELRPFSLSHRIALSALDSPFLAGDKPIAPSDLLLALRVCSHTDAHRRTVGRPSFAEKLRYWRWVFNHELFVRACGDFVRYMEVQACGPKLLGDDREPAGRNDLPWELCVLATLVRNGYTESEAWNMSESTAVWFYVAFLRADGADIKLWSPDHDAAVAILKSHTP